LAGSLFRASELYSTHNNFPLLIIFTGISSTAIIDVLKAITNSNALVIELFIKIILSNLILDQNKFIEKINCLIKGINKLNSCLNIADLFN